jgi:hypothetical protein
MNLTPFPDYRKNSALPLASMHRYAYHPRMDKPRFFRTTITVPADLKRRMDAVKEEVNWSALAASAFEAKLAEIAKKKEIKKMVNYFEEKARQIDPGELTAFGMVISSRYDQADEMVELIAFARLVAEKKVTPYVKQACYNSKASLCTIELDSSVHEEDAVADAILEAATETLTQFDWFGNPILGRQADRFNTTNS